MYLMVRVLIASGPPLFGGDPKTGPGVSGPGPAGYNPKFTNGTQDRIGGIFAS